MMKQFIAAAGALLALAVQAEPQTSQVTHGWCSPAVSHVGQNVTIVCQGVDPKALARLNELLELKDQQLGQRIREAEEWTRKYHELKSRLATTADSSEQEQRAMALLKEGRLDEAGKLLDDLLKTEDDVLRRLARNHYNRAEVFALQFYPVQALPHYRKAYQLAPDSIDYALALANVLAQQRELSEAQSLYAKVLAMTETAGGDATVLLARAKALEGIGQVVPRQQSVDHFERAVSIYRQLNTAKAGAYSFDLARSLQRLAYGIYARDFRDVDSVTKHSNEAVVLFEGLAAKYPAKRSYYLAYAMGTLMTMAMAQRVSVPEPKQQETLDRMMALHEKIRAASADYVTVEMAGSFTMVALTYITRSQYLKAEEAAGNAIAILEKRAALGDEYYAALPALYLVRSLALTSLGRREQALGALEQGTHIARQLAERSPKQYAPQLDMLLEKLAQAQRTAARHEEAKRTEEERRAIREQYGLK